MGQRCPVRLWLTRGFAEGWYARRTRVAQACRRAGGVSGFGARKNRAGCPCGVSSREAREWICVDLPRLVDLKLLRQDPRMTTRHPPNFVVGSPLDDDTEGREWLPRHDPTATEYDVMRAMTERARDWRAWWETASRHRASALAVLDAYLEASAAMIVPELEGKWQRQTTMLVDDCLMLMGFALENVLKGALVTEYPEPFRMKGEQAASPWKLVWPLSTHDLLRLFRFLKIMPLGEEPPIWRQFLAAATVYVSGPVARFPIAADPTAAVVKGAGIEPSGLVRQFDEIFERISLAMLERHNAEVEAILVRETQEPVRAYRCRCSHAEWLRWQLYREWPISVADPRR
jgi:hypothetical protein